MVEFANDLITVDEMCIGGGGLVHTSKFTVFMALKVVVCIGSNMRFFCIEVISSNAPRFLAGMVGGDEECL